MVSRNWVFLGKDNPHLTNLLIVALNCTGITTASQAIITATGTAYRADPADPRSDPSARPDMQKS